MGLAGMTRDATPSIVRINPGELGTPPGYSQIVDVSAGRIIFIAGQTALDGNGKLVGKADFPAQAAQVFRNLAIALEASGCTASNLVKLTVFLTRHEQSRALSRGAQPLLRLGDAAGRARRDAGRGVEAVWSGFH